MAKTQDVEAVIAALPEPSRATMSRLRRLILDCLPGLTEHIKWNGPSFLIDGDDRITLGTDKSGAVRVVFHRGVKAKDTTAFAFTDDSGLVKWAAVDRGVVMFADTEAVEAQAEVFAILSRRWLETTR